MEQEVFESPEPEVLESHKLEVLESPETDAMEVYLGMGLLSCHRELGENWFKAVIEPIWREKYFDP